MRIGIDARVLMEAQQTGVQVYARELFEALLASDHDNEYIFFINAFHEPIADFSFLQSYRNARLVRKHVPNKVLNVLLWYFGFPRIDRWIGGCDVFFMPNINFVALTPALPLVVVAHDLSFHLFPETFSFRRRLWHYLVHPQRLLLRAERIIAVSHSTAEDVARYYRIPKSRIVVIPSGVRSHFVPADRNDPRLLTVVQRYRLPYRFIFSLGTEEPRKNILSLVEAYEALQREGPEELRRYELVLAGAAGWKNGTLFDHIAHSRYRDRIHRIGFIAPEDQAAAYSLASVFVYPSLYEGFGFPPLEAAACGTPVIAAHSSSLPEILGKAALYIDPLRPDELRQALREVLLSKELQALLRVRGRERAAGFRFSRTAEETLRVIVRSVEAGEGKGMV